MLPKYYLRKFKKWEGNNKIWHKETNPLHWNTMLCIKIPLFNSVIVVWNNSREIQTNIKLLTKIDKAIVKYSHKYFQGTVMSKDVTI